MEARFAFALKANLFKICRLCGIDYPEKVPIISERSGTDSDELDLGDKIYKFIGILIASDDKMPQEVCTLCVDKINDFYEFREMCLSTNAQTRKLLGLKAQSAIRVAKKETIAEIKSETGTKKRSLKEVKELKGSRNLCADAKSEPTKKRVLKRKCKEEVSIKLDFDDELFFDQKEPNLKFDSTVQQSKKLKIGPMHQKHKLRNIKNSKLLKSKLKFEPLESSTSSKFNCTICNEGFGQRNKLEQHQVKTHVPQVHRFVCVSCDEIIQKTNDIKNHQLWHKLSKTPYVCGLCGEPSLNVYTYARHLRDHNEKVPFTLLVLDRQCPQCHKTFVTNYLFNIHSCAISTKKCAGCNRQQRNAQEYIRHAAFCAQTYFTHSKHIPVAMDETNIRIKNETNDITNHTIDLSMDMSPLESTTHLLSHNLYRDKLTDMVALTKKGSKKSVCKRNLKRVDELLKSTMNALVSIKHEPEVHVDNDHSNKGVSPQSEIVSRNRNSVDEVDEDVYMNDSYVDNSDSENEDGVTSCNGAIQNSDNLSSRNSQGEITIKCEVGAQLKEVSENLPSGSEKVPVLKLKIKKEHGTLNSSIVEDSTRVDKKKKKKKKKEASKDKVNLSSDGHVNNLEIVNNASDRMLSEAAASSIYIKTENVEEGEGTDNIHSLQVGESLRTATVMTSIPYMQFQISCVSSGVATETFEENSSLSHKQIEDNEQDEVDVKPTQQQLDQMLKISNITAGVELMPEEETRGNNSCDQTESAIDNYANSDKTCETLMLPQIIAVVGAAENDDIKPNLLELDKALNISHEDSSVLTTPKTLRKTSSKLHKKITTQFKHNIAANTDSVNDSELPKITAVISYADSVHATENVKIKEEPIDTGYHAVEDAQNPCRSSSSCYREDGYVETSADYSGDFLNVCIKEEKDIDIPTDFGFTPEHMKSKDEKEYESTEQEDDENSVDNYIEEPEEEREYRELELIPLDQDATVQITTRTHNENENGNAKISHSSKDNSENVQNNIKEQLWNRMDNDFSTEINVSKDKGNKCEHMAESCNYAGSVKDVTENMAPYDKDSLYKDENRTLRDTEIISSKTKRIFDSQEPQDELIGKMISNQLEDVYSEGHTIVRESIDTIDQMNTPNVSGVVNIDFNAELSNYSHHYRRLTKYEETSTNLKIDKSEKTIAVGENINQKDLENTTDTITKSLDSRNTFLAKNSKELDDCIIENYEAVKDKNPDHKEIATEEESESIVNALVMKERTTNSQSNETVHTDKIVSKDLESELSQCVVRGHGEDTNFIPQKTTNANVSFSSLVTELTETSMVDQDVEKTVDSGSNEQIAIMGVGDHCSLSAQNACENQETKSNALQQFDLETISTTLDTEGATGSLNEDIKENQEEVNNVDDDVCNSQSSCTELNTEEATIVGQTFKSKEHLLDGKPSTSANPTISNVGQTDDQGSEEHENLLNHSLVEQNITSNPLYASSTDLSTLASTSSDIRKQISKLNSEEYENTLNESVNAERHSVSTNAASTSHFLGSINNRQRLYVGTNLNEIAENNNNANIERELEDEASTTIER